MLSLQEQKEVAEILSRRANEIASFKSDLEERVSQIAGKEVRFYGLPGSVELALSREINRIRDLEAKVRPVFNEEEQ